MKNIGLVLLLSLILIGCKREENTPVAPLMEVVDANAVLQIKGEFSGAAGESVSGKAKIVSDFGKYSLVLENFMTNNGPDLHVYLSAELSPKTFIDLGKLKSISGTQVYAIAGAPDFSKYKYALIHCQQANHLFGSALLAK